MATLKDSGRSLCLHEKCVKNLFIDKKTPGLPPGFCIVPIALGAVNHVTSCGNEKKPVFQNATQACLSLTIPHIISIIGDWVYHHGKGDFHGRSQRVDPAAL
jgi:hypothetical protein